MRQAVEIIVIRARQFAGFVKRLKGSPEKKQATIRKRQRNETRGPSRVLSPHALDGDGFEYVTSRAGTNAEAAAASEEKKKKEKEIVRRFRDDVVSLALTRRRSKRPSCRARWEIPKQREV